MKHLLSCLVLFMGFFPLAAPAARAADGPAPSPVILAAVFSRTGEPARGTAEEDFRGAALAVAEINAAGGLLGRPVELREYDNAGTPLTARQAAQKAVADGALAAVMGPWSSLTLAMAGVFQESGVPAVATIATHPDVTAVGDYIFRVCFVDALQGRLLARFARERLGAATAAICVNVQSDYSMALAGFFARAFESAGGRIVRQADYKTRTTDFRDILTEIKGLSPDLVFVPGYAGDSSLILRQARAMGLTANFLGGDGWGPEMPDIAGPAVEGAVYATHWHPDAANPRNRDFLARYQAQYGRLPRDQGDAALAYDAIMVLAEAVRRAGSADRAAIRAVLAGLKDHKGVTGTVSFGPGRDPERKELAVMRFLGGRATFVTMQD